MCLRTEITRTRIDQQDTFFHCDKTFCGLGGERATISLSACPIANLQISRGEGNQFCLKCIANIVEIMKQP